MYGPQKQNNEVEDAGMQSKVDTGMKMSVHYELLPPHYKKFGFEKCSFDRCYSLLGLCHILYNYSVILFTL